MKKSTHILWIILLAALLLGACTEVTEFTENLPPQTSLMVDSSVNVDPTHYLQVLHWHGEDQDGEVARYEYKWTLDPAVAAGDFDTTWVGRVEPFVTWESDSFFLPVPETQALHAFQVRAVDWEGLADPSPAYVELPVFNSPPSILYQRGEELDTLITLPAEILPVYSLKFKVEDPDDDEGLGALIEEVRFWFEDPDDYISIPGADTLFTLMPEHFGEGVGINREFHLQAVDRAGAKSNVLRGEAVVKDISEVELLILDSCDSGTTAEITADSYWKNDVAGLFPPEKVYVHDFDEFGGLGQPEVLYNIFSIFKAVLWYNGDAGFANDELFTSIPTPEIQEAEEALLAYLEGGGKVLITGWNLVGASVRDQVEPGQPPGPENYSGASFSEDFDDEVLLLDEFRHHSVSTENHESSNFRLFPGREIVGYPEIGTETLRNMTALTGIDLMLPNEDALGAGTLESLYSVNGAVDTYPQTLGDGVVGLRRYFDQDGEMVLLTFPLSLAFGYGNALGEAESFLQHFELLP